MTVGLVLDASIAVTWAFEDEGGDVALSVAEVLVDSFAVVPPLWHVEVGNALSIGLRRTRIDVEGVRRFLDSMSVFDIRTDTAPPDAGRLAVAAGEWSLTAYDTSYLMLALDRGLRLATADHALAGAAVRAGVPVFPAG